VKLTIKRIDVAEPIEIELVRRVITSPIVEWKMEDESTKIGYIALHQFNEKSDQMFDKALTDLESRGMRAMVLDLRGNPGGLLDVAIEIGSRLISNGDIVVIQDKGGRQSRYGVEPRKQNHRLYPLVVLIDGSSASASEIIAGAIQDNKAGTLVGTDSFGKGKVQTIMNLPDGSAVVITTAKYYTPSMRDVDKLKIHPDVVVEPTDDDIKNDVDSQLNKAVGILKTRLDGSPTVAGNGSNEKS
jgi:carboxyl-terminal processing protease